MISFLLGAASAATWVVGEDAPSVQAAIDAAAPGDTVALPEGRWPGPVELNKAITLTSTGGVLDGQGVGTVLRVSGAGAVIDGLRVENSGDDRQTEDACIRTLSSAVGAVLTRNRLRGCGFGIWVHEGRHIRVEGNHVVGREGGLSARKGNGIHLFDGEHLVVRDNLVEHSRDGIYVGVTEHSLIEGNRASHQRYGIHYMYSLHNTIRGNVATHNTGGIALMQSHDLHVEGNQAHDNEEKGILFRDVYECKILNNEVSRNGEGMFFFSSVRNEIRDNLLHHNDIGARVWAGTVDNVVVGNRFLANRQQLFYVSASDQTWGDGRRGNRWSDYLGWDQDGDGIGDRPYRADSLTASLLHRYPASVLLLSSPALELLGYLQARMPAFRVPTVIDPHPEVR